MGVNVECKSRVSKTLEYAGLFWENDVLQVFKTNCVESQILQNLSISILEDISFVEDKNNYDN